MDDGTARPAAELTARPVVPVAGPPLEYGRQDPRRLRRRRWARRAMMLLLLGCVVTVYVQRHRIAYAWERWQVLRTQAKCLAYSRGPEAVAFDSAANPRPPGTPFYEPMVVPESAPDCWLRMTPNKEYCYNRRRGTVLFLHGRTPPGGAEQLVCVQLDGCSDRALNIEYCVDPLQTWTPTRAGGGVCAVSIPLSRQPHRLVFYAGQPDPADPAHFTIRYRADDREGVLDFVLQADGSLRLAMPKATEPDSARR